MRTLKAIGHSPLTPFIGAALAAVGALALIGFSLVARVSLPGDGDPGRTVVRSSAGSVPGAIVLPTPFAAAAPQDTTSAPLPSAGVDDGAVVIPPTTGGVDVSSPPAVVVPVDDGLGARPGPGGLRPPSFGPDERGGPSRAPTSEKGPKLKDGGGSGPERSASDDGWSGHDTRKSSYDRGASSKAPKVKAPKVKGTHGGASKAKSHAHHGKALGHEKTKGKGHSKHKH